MIIYSIYKKLILVNSLKRKSKYRFVLKRVGILLKANVQDISEKSSLRSKGESLFSNLYRRLTVKRETYYDVRLLKCYNKFIFISCFIELGW